MRKLHDLTCQACGKSFRGRAYQLFCSDACMQIPHAPRKRKINICKRCAKPIPGNVHRTYCSSECRAMSSKLSSVPDTGTCRICGQVVHAHYGCRGKTLNTTCGRPSCRVATAWGAGRNPYPDRACSVCGATFSPTAGNQLCCSNECRRIRNTAAERSRRAGTRGTVAVESLYDRDAIAALPEPSTDPRKGYCTRCFGMPHRRPRNGCKVCGEPREKRYRQPAESYLVSPMGAPEFSASDF